MDVWLTTVILGAIVFVLLYKLATKDTNYFKERGIKGQSSYFNVIQSIIGLVFQKKQIADILIETYRKFEGEKLIGYFQFSKPFVMILDPELISQVLIKDFSHFQDRGTPIDEKLEPLSGNLSNITGKKWRILRYKMTPTFTSGKLKNMFNQIKDCSDDALKYLKLYGDEQLDARMFAQKFVVNAIGSVAFSINVDAFNETKKDNKFYQYSTKFFAPSWNLILKFMIKTCSPKLSSFLRLRLSDLEVANFFQTMTKNIIEDREKTNVRRNDFLQLMLDLKKQELATGPFHDVKKPIQEATVPNKSEYEEEEDRALLDQLQDTSQESGDNGQLFTDNWLAANTFNFISAGSETTSAVLSFVFYFLAVNPEVQKKAQEEIDNILSNQSFDYKAVKAMMYLDGIIYETIRFYPPGTIIQRVCTEDYKVPGTDALIEKGTYVTIPVVAIHRDPQYYPNPEQFNPERFEDLKSLQKVFFPFGGGPRICIAMRLAMLKMKVFTASVLWKFNIKLGEKTNVPIKLKLNSFLQYVEGGLWLKFQERL